MFDFVALILRDVGHGGDISYLELLFTPLAERTSFAKGGYFILRRRSRSMPYALYALPLHDFVTWRDLRCTRYAFLPFYLNEVS